MAKTKLILVVTVDEKVLPKGNALTELPDQLYTAIQATLPLGALKLSSVYLADPKKNIEDTIIPCVLNYHHYAVDIRGETCNEENCEQHPVRNVLDFHDHKQRNRNPPGVN